MTDERIRKLERSARQGDEDAVSRLAHERRRTAASGPGGWEAATAYDRHLAEAIPSLERSLEALKSLRSQGNERGRQTTWEQVAQAARHEELATELARAIVTPTSPTPRRRRRRTTRAAAVTPTLQVTLETSRYETPEPSVLVRFPSRTHFRAAHGALHDLAAAVERATPPGEGWIVQLEPGDNGARLYLELATADPAETDRGLTLLRDVAAAAEREGRATR